MSAKIKKQLINTKICTNCFTPTHLKFNLSFISYSDGLTPEHKVALFDRMIELSKEPMIVLQSRNKSIGFELERIDIKKEINPKFFESQHRTFDGKYHIFRIYTNNNPIVARVIGKIIKNVFYIFFIDIGGKLYNH